MRRIYLTGEFVKLKVVFYSITDDAIGEHEMNVILIEREIERERGEEDF